MDAATSNSPSPSSTSTPKTPRPPRRIVTYTILGGAVLTLFAVLGVQRQSRAIASQPPRAVAVAPAPRAPEPPDPGPVAQSPVAVARPRVELVFALDTTGSMGGLIEGAKKKIWSLASFVAQGQPTPDLRVGLIAYRDIGDAYVTKVFDLDGDLDRVYRRLRSFHAEGGGDGPEHVARALHESVHKMSWTGDQSVVKVIYLVGDAPPHTDYNDGYDTMRAARAAANKGIQLHTIQCGTDGAAASAWRRIASLGGGQYMAIHQDGGMEDEHTRYDDELARLHDKLGHTVIGFGAAAPAAMAETREAEAAPVAVKAARAGFMAKKGKAVGGKGDLVESIASGAVKLEEVQGDLPADMKAMPQAKQAEVIAAKQKERNELSKRIDELSALRRKELDAREAKAAKEGGADGFDVAAKKALRSSVKANTASGLDL
jgi:Mg-chelatase subunit ChlD